MQVLIFFIFLYFAEGTACGLLYSVNTLNFFSFLHNNPHGYLSPCWFYVLKLVVNNGNNCLHVHKKIRLQFRIYQTRNNNPDSTKIQSHFRTCSSSILNENVLSRTICISFPLFEIQTVLYEYTFYTNKRTIVGYQAKIYKM